MGEPKIKNTNNSYRKGQKNQKTIALIAMLGVMAICVSIYLFLNTSSSYTLSDKAFQVVAGEKVIFESGTSFIYKENGPTFRGASEGEYLNNSPIYLKEEDKILIPDDSIYVDGRKVTFHKINSFNEIDKSEKIKYKGKFMNGGFLYDGKKTYTFLEGMTLKVNGQKIEVGEFSSITLSSNQIYCLYNTLDKQISVDRIYTDTLVASTNDYQVDVLNDVLFDIEEKKILLVNRADILDEYE